MLSVKESISADADARPVSRGDDAVDLTALVSEGLALLGPKTAALIDLTRRPGMVVDLREGAAPHTLTLARERVEQALAIFVLVRTRVTVCPGLRTLVGTGGSLRAGLTAMVIAHLDACGGCADAWSQIPPPLDLLRPTPAEVSSPALRAGIVRWIGRRNWRWFGATTHWAYAAGVAALLVLSLGFVAVVGSGGAKAANDLEASSAAPVREVIPVPAEARLPAVEQTTTTTVPAPTTTVAVAVEPAPTSVVSPGVPSDPPLVTIVTPFDGQRFTSSSVIDLVAVVEDDVDNGLVVEWHAGSTYLTTGNSISVTSASGCPDSVTYTVTATATDSSGNTTETGVTFIVQCEASTG